MGLILEAQGKPAEARQTYEKIVARSPEAAVASNNLAWLLAEQGADLDAALQLAQAAQRVSPDSPQVSDTLGWVYYKKEIPTLAVRSFEASVKADPNEPLFRYHLALAHMQGGNASKARTELDVALKLKPGYPEAVKARQTLEAAVKAP